MMTLWPFSIIVSQCAALWNHLSVLLTLLFFLFLWFEKTADEATPCYRLTSELWSINYDHHHLLVSITLSEVSTTMSPYSLLRAGASLAIRLIWYVDSTASWMWIISDGSSDQICHYLLCLQRNHKAKQEINRKRGTNDCKCQYLRQLG